jgi:uncharacterized SAM-binding protein YcdF (DUF218 family)
MNRSGALIGASLCLLGTVTYFATDLPRPIGNATLAAILAAAIGGVLGGFAQARRLATVCTVVAAIVALFGFTPLMRGPVHSWVRRDSIPADRLDAVIVLSSAVNADSLLDAAAVERLLTGLAVFRDNGARLLVTTRNGLGPGGRMESDADRRRLVDLAADTARWHTVGPVHTTHDEAVKTAALLLPLDQRRVAVVTSPLHTRRACRAFEKAGFQVTCVPSDERLYSIRAFDTPATRLKATADWFYETLAMLEYRVRGWV